ncbi:PilW family protein [Andreprevotia chitinilytica]|uniref:PilW family protein n=1 Tax=Andreprevotia chitinilytica TaxID=396808 RepID=UPI000689768F|nr:PilW family protein [Andreprevotia chitinilytica]
MKRQLHTGKSLIDVPKANCLRQIKPAVLAQRGFGLLEVMISMTIALLLLLAVSTLFISQRQTYSAQTGLAQLQEKERLAVSLLTNIIQSAGYFPNPTTNTQVTALPVLGTTYTTPGQYVTGATGGTGSSDTIQVRYQTAPGDGILNCLGNSNPTGTGSTNKTYDNAFTVQTVNGTSMLTCALGTNAAAPTASTSANPLVDGIQSMKVTYGVDTTGNGSVTQYVDASSVTDWTSVRSAQLVLVFTNPLYNTAAINNNGQPSTVKLTQIVRLMGKS